MAGTANLLRACHLQDVVGRVEPCPGARCPFWEPSAGRKAEGCSIETLGLDLRGRPDLAQHLLELRRELDTCRADGGADTSRSLFYRLLDEDERVESRR